MTPTKVLLLLSSLSIAFANTILAQAVGPAGFYFGLSAGPQWRAEASDSAGSTTFKTGFAVNGSLGYRMQAHRLEAEFSYFNNRCKTTDPAGPAIGVEPSSGSVDVDALMGNYYYDFSLGERRIQPYLSAGFGVYRVSINGLTTPSLRALPAEWGGPVVVYAKSTWTSVYQFRGGIKFSLTPAADLVLGYRLLQGSELDINLADGSTIHPDARIQCLEAGLRLKF
jgi:opacity protein-like surface antigen